MNMSSRPDADLAIVVLGIKIVCPGILLQECLSRLTDALVWNKDLGVDFLHRNWAHEKTGWVKLFF